MTSNNPPAWKYWHPLPLWKVLLIFAGAEAIGVMGGVLLFPMLGMSGDTGLMVGAAVFGTLAYLIVVSLARKARASTAGSDGV